MNAFIPLLFQILKNFFIEKKNHTFIYLFHKKKKKEKKKRRKKKKKERKKDNVTGTENELETLKLTNLISSIVGTYLEIYAIQSTINIQYFNNFDCIPRF